MKKQEVKRFNPTFNIKLILMHFGTSPFTFYCSVRFGHKLSSHSSLPAAGELVDMYNMKECYIGEDGEVIMCNLHDAIYLAARSIADFCVVIYTDEIRGEFVKDYFKERIRQAQKNSKELDWNQQDIELVNRYFACNN